jgi:hypothetical protein
MRVDNVMEERSELGGMLFDKGSNIDDVSRRRIWGKAFKGVRSLVVDIGAEMRQEFSAVSQSGATDGVENEIKTFNRVLRHPGPGSSSPDQGKNCEETTCTDPLNDRNSTTPKALVKKNII